MGTVSYLHPTSAPAAIGPAPIPAPSLTQEEWDEIRIAMHRRQVELRLQALQDDRRGYLASAAQATERAGFVSGIIAKIKGVRS